MLDNQTGDHSRPCPLASRSALAESAGDGGQSTTVLLNGTVTGEREVWNNDRHMLAATAYFWLVGTIRLSEMLRCFLPGVCTCNSVQLAGSK